MKREVLFTAKNGSSNRVLLDLQGQIFNPPEYVQYSGRLYMYTGSGAGKDGVNFYREVQAQFHIVHEENADA